jgi:hypothetical protein
MNKVIPMNPAPAFAATLLRPGLALMQRLRMPAKLSLVAASLVLPLLLLMALSVSALLSERRATLLELDGVAVATTVATVHSEAQRLRGYTYRVLNGDTEAAASRDGARRALKDAVTALDRQLAEQRDPGLGDSWKALNSRLLELAEERHANAPAEAFEQFSLAVEATRQLALLNGERSGLLLDPEPRSYFLMSVVVEHALPLAEAVAVARGLGAGALARGQLGAGDRVELLSQIGQMQRAAADTGSKLAALERAGGEAPGSWPQAR